MESETGVARGSRGAPSNKGMKLTKLSAAWLLEWTCRLMPAPSWLDAGTASQLIPGVRRTLERGGMRGRMTRRAAIVLVVAAAAAGCRGAGTFRVPGGGMEPNIAVGQTIRLEPERYARSADVRRGDVIVFHSPDDATRLFVKRVVALPGEVVSATDGRVSINGAELPQQREGDATIELAGVVRYRVKVNLPCREHSDKLVLPSDAFFVMGDNRCASRDSRAFGPVGFAAIVGKVVL